MTIQQRRVVSLLVVLAFIVLACVGWSWVYSSQSDDCTARGGHLVVNFGYDRKWHPFDCEDVEP